MLTISDDLNEKECKDAFAESLARQCMALRKQFGKVQPVARIPSRGNPIRISFSNHFQPFGD